MRQQTNPRPRRGRSGGRRPGTQRNQNFDSNGPSVRVRGNAYQVMEKYLALARDATAIGDRIAAENYYQHAEHYFRILNANSGANANSGSNADANGSGRENPSKANGQGRNKAEENRAKETKIAETKVEEIKPDKAKPEEAKAEEAQADKAKPDKAKPDKTKTDVSKTAGSKAAGSKAGEVKTETPAGAEEKSAKGAEPQPVE